MDTDEELLETDFYVRMAGEEPPKLHQEYYQKRMDDPDDSVVGFNTDPLRDHHILNEDVPIDGIVAFYYPGGLDPDSEQAPWSFTFPFRDHRRDDAPWFAFPDRPEWERHPVWKWENPEKGRENITLSPSLGVGQPMTFHCWIRDGEVAWL